MSAMRRRVPACVVLALWGTSVSLAAQAIPLIPTTAAPTQTNASGSPRPELTLQGSSSGGYDQNTSAALAAAGTANPLFRPSSTHLGGDLQLQYTVPGTRVNFAAGGGTSFRMYRADSFLLASHSAVVGVSAAVTPHLTVQSTAIATYAPPFQYSLFPSLDPNALGQSTLSPFDSVLSAHHVLSYGAGGGLSYRPTKRSSFVLDYDFRDVSTDNRVYGGRTQYASGAYMRNIAKGLGVRLGYRYQLTEFVDRTTGARTPVRADNYDIGLDYGLSRGLSLSRSTSLSFRFGAAALDYGHARRLQVVGNANLTQQLGRRWSLGGGYNRGLNFVDGFGVPVFADAATLRLTGRLSRRISARGTFGYSYGGIDDLSSTARLHARRATFRIQTALTRSLDAFAQYSYYRHAFPDTLQLAPGVPAIFSRQGVSVGLSFSVPLVGGRNARRPVLPVLP
jgi:hypothetical protein